MAAIAPANAETLLFPQALILARNSSQTQTRLIFADARGVSERLAEQCQAQGDTCLLVRPGEDYAKLSPGEYRLDPLQAEHYRRLLRDAGDDITSIVHLWNLDISEADAGDACTSALYLSQALLRSANPPPLWLVTQGAAAIEAAEPFQAPLWGFGLVLEKEHPELRCRLLDLDPAKRADAADDLIQALDN
ncbi:KR prefix domain-containing protein, partial [Methylogaea oryzae]|uniref:KR prefix domain-containing protein n=1 Tax=Methylogaea oryzae TaxID=1295382 RepID=UPI001C3F2EAF